MFKEGNGNVDIAIALNLSTAKVISLYHDYLKLSNLDKLINLYYDLDKDLKLSIELYERMKSEGLLTTKDIVNIARAQVQLRDLIRNIYVLYDEIGRLNIIKMDLR
ncbi:hypothetical protein NMY3_02671 [Candidatus Nitrosocosmicus oleophilus]|uniref:Uncharacterized protein n=1 Tax=Candidatus Nitrosocosmicus oleophilus TaxID=1353260 RepID=A0A654M2T5_9ARCH|nr:hypothetical protein [Candidatus Nitrosocosmicus oleophilus]ALI36861.1 hypothetical protein NMY3_02671 [Candidatus Nitrosocosmicus oleophilus]